ncbi:MAG TPA: hypothetical protein ENN80_02250, partial [Candidatus Hydrogenedentes bacterium]|nr:hypothetical protein [Candidatus Hydrogenedentota bacterium]
MEARETRTAGSLSLGLSALLVLGIVVVYLLGEAPLIMLTALAVSIVCMPVASWLLLGLVALLLGLCVPMSEVA